MIRLLIVWLVLLCTVRLMGKRQIGEMQMSEFITAFMLSELAALPVTDAGIPLLFSVVPMVLLAVLEILSSFAFLRLPGLARLAAGTPVVLIRMGEIDQRALLRTRMTTAELMGELRQKNVTDPEDVAYAILEENGKLSVIPRKSVQPPEAKSLGQPIRETGICHTLISGGQVSRAGLTLSGKTETDIRTILEDSGCADIREIFLMTVDDAGTCRIVRKKESEGKG